MATPPRRRSARGRPAPAASPAPAAPEPAARKKAGRPPGPPSTIVNIRIPVELLERLNRHIDRLVRTGQKANRATITLQALAAWLDTHDPD